MTTLALCVVALFSFQCRAAENKDNTRPGVFNHVSQRRWSNVSSASFLAKELQPPMKPTVGASGWSTGQMEFSVTDGACAYTDPGDVSTALLPYLVSVDSNGILTFATENTGQSLSFACVEGTGNVFFGSADAFCHFNVFVPSTCMQYTIAAKDTTNKGLVPSFSQTYNAEVVSGQVIVPLIEGSITLPPVTVSSVVINFVSVDYEATPGQSEYVNAIVKFTILPSNLKDIVAAPIASLHGIGSSLTLENEPPLPLPETNVVDPKTNAPAVDATGHLIMTPEVYNTPYTFSVNVHLSCSLATPPPQIDIVGWACIAKTPTLCGARSTKSLAFSLNPSKPCAFTSSMLPDLAASHPFSQAVQSSNTNLKIGQPITFTLHSQYYDTTPYGFNLDVQINGITMGRTCYTLSTTDPKSLQRDATAQGSASVKTMVLQFTAGDAHKNGLLYIGCNSPGDLRFVTGRKGLQTFELTFIATPATTWPVFNGLATGGMIGHGQRRDIVGLNLSSVPVVASAPAVVSLTTNFTVELSGSVGPNIAFCISLMFFSLTF
ncbi:hypothetical protein BC830DRAFT_1156466 [Chytriomyces sp. MP71]|nr:hypothetical protein BC830DRAFT_1156466 [Chytriomyces sp. MP71]